MGETTLAKVGDRMLQVPYLPDVPVPDKVARIRTAADQIAHTLMHDFLAETPHPMALRGAMILACQPSLEALARSEIRTGTIATEVTTNIQELADFALTRGYDTSEGGVIGIASELSILGVAWWGIANGCFARNSYALPATRKQDMSDPGRLRNGIDIRMRVNRGSAKKKLVQVKTSVRDNKRYQPHIKVISPQHLVPPHPVFENGQATSALLRYLANDQAPHLFYANDRLQERLTAA